MPKHGNIATYTSACAKNQNQRCQMLVAETENCGATPKKCVPASRSESSNTLEADKTLKISRLRIAVRNHAHTVIGSRGIVIPRARCSITVTLRFSAAKTIPIEKHTTPSSQIVAPAAGVKKTEAVIPASAAAVIQKETPLNRGNAISRAPI